MGLLRCAALILCVATGFACGSDSATTETDASGTDSAPAPSDAGPPDALGFDAPAPADGSSSDRSSPDASSPDATMPEGGCVPSHARFTAPADASCPSPDDTDHDGVPDCLDGCPYDPNKIAPGVCGCNTPDVDSDGDGIPDCLDQCPGDPNNTANGQCGCLGEPGLQPAGIPCTDTACPETGATCNGAGVCGDRSMCSPCPGGHFVVSQDRDRYWFCSRLPPVTGPGCIAEDAGGVPGATRMAAQSACAAKGLTLARIGTPDANRFVATLLTSHVWLGGNDLQTPGQWYWSSATSDSDTAFWSGGPDGGPQGNLFSNWASGSPGASSCMSIAPIDGHWSDTDCSQTLGYLCQ